MGQNPYLVIIYFAALAVINFVLYAVLSKYLYTSAGVTKEDARKYISEQGANQQARLVKWMWRRTKHPKEYGIMLLLCNALVFLGLFSAFIIFIALKGRSPFFVKVFMVAVPVLSLAVSAFGFRFGKKTEADFGSELSGSEYTPYAGENILKEIESLDELYYTSEEDTALSEEAAEVKARYRKRYKIFRYVFGVIMVGMMLIMFFSPVIFSKLPQNADNHVQIQSEAETEYRNTEKKAVTSETVEAFLNRDGFHCHDALREAEESYSSAFDFKECVIADEEEGMFFGYYRLGSEESANVFQQQRRAEIEERCKKNGKTGKEQNEKHESFALYTMETDESYLVSICSEDIVIYAYCDSINAAWLKTNLYSIGYLDDF